jgi:hypothetical protein
MTETSVLLTQILGKPSAPMPSCSNPRPAPGTRGLLAPAICGQKWLTRFTPFFTESERKHAACQHRLFFAQVEYCDNLIFRRRAPFDQLGERVPRVQQLAMPVGAHVARWDPELKRFYRRKVIQKGFGKASVAVTLKLGIRLWIMLRDQFEYNEFCRRGQKQQKSIDACAGMPETPDGAKSHRSSD